MEHLQLLHDLGWLMIAAGAAAVLFRRLKQPAIIGYLLAGLLLGPNLLPFSPVHEMENIQELSELGVLFLMFYIGLEFNLSKLRPVAGASLLALVLQTVTMVMLGTTAAQLMDWTVVEGLFLGGILSISSSMVTFKLIGERGELGRPYAQFTAGILILEDFLAIILLVVLAGVAVSGKLEWIAVGKTTFFVGMFVVAVFVAGKLLAPHTLRLLHRFGNNETITLFTVALILGVSLLAARFQFSLALGGFLAGAILSRSSLAEEIEGLTAPLRDFFSALFFVTVGTLIDPHAIFEYLGPIIAITFLVIVGKFVSCWMGNALAGVRASTATRASLAKVQIGEFSFIIAALAASLGVANPALSAVASGVAILTILLTPAAVALGERLIARADSLVPARLHRGLRVYDRWFETVRLTLRASPFLQTARRPFLQIIVDFLLLAALILVASVGAEQLPFGDDPEWRTNGQRLVWAGAALLSIPIQVAVLRSINVITMIFAELTLSWPVLRPLGQGPMRELVRWGIFSLVFVVFAGAFLTACAPYFPTGVSLLIFAGTCGLMVVLFWRRAVHMQSRMESTLFEALRDPEGSAMKTSVEDAIARMAKETPWQVHPAEVEIPRHARVTGKRIRDLAIRSQTGATIVAVQRSGVVHFDVSPELPLSPQDCVLVVGNSGQVAEATRFLTAIDPHPEPQRSLPHSFERVLVTANSEICGLSLREANIRARFNVTIVGIQRGEQQNTGPSPDEVLQDGDLLLLMGRETDIAQLREAILQA